MTMLKNTSSHIEIDEVKLKADVEKAAESAMQNEIEILRSGKVERTFAKYFADEIAKIIRQEDIRIDPFYNKHLGAAKKLGGKLIELDIAVHERHVDINNLVAIEFETNNYPAEDDVWKLEALTRKLDGFGYKLGLYIVFGIEKKAGQILVKRWFKDGKTL